MWAIPIYSSIVSGDAWSRPPSWTADVGVLVCGVRVPMSVVRVKHGFMVGRCMQAYMQRDATCRNSYVYVCLRGMSCQMMLDVHRRKSDTAGTIVSSLVLSRHSGAIARSWQ